MHYKLLCDAGTHDILNATLSGTIFRVSYSENSCARGALFSFLFIDDSGALNFERSTILALDKNRSLRYDLPFGLYPGRYRISFYDIEEDGTLCDGVSYPAITIPDKKFDTGSDQGTNKSGS